MATKLMSDPTQVCEDVLREEKAYNIEHAIWPSVNRIFDRLLDRRLELVSAYAEIHAALHARPHAIKAMFEAVAEAAAFWNPEKVAEAREARTRLGEVNREIADLARSLSALLDEREEIGNKSGFASDPKYHIVDVIDAASIDNGFYRSFLKEELSRLSHRYDLKYWPGLAEIVKVIGQDADLAGVAATDELTRAATTGSRGSRADFFKALLAAIEQRSTGSFGDLPRGFALSDNSLASLANCALDLGPDALVDAAHVKRLRQRERERRGKGK